MTNRRLLVLLAFLLSVAARAGAQVTIYGTFAPTHVTNLATGPTAYNTTSFWVPATTIGVSFNFIPLPVVSLGTDFRYSTKQGTNGADSYLAGIKLGAKAPKIPFKPYIEAVGGIVHTRGTSTSGSSTTNSFGTYEIIGGVDHPIAALLDWRIAEVSVGKGKNTAAFSFPDINIVSLQTGLTVHF